MRQRSNDWEPGFRPRPRGGYFGRGGVRFVILELLKEQPRHGYDIIREIEERSGGIYTPSPGVIYPTLQALEDQDYVKSQEQEGKKVYYITDSGLAYLEGHKEQGHGTRATSGSGFGAWFASGEMPELMKELRWFFGDFAGAIQRTVSDPQKLREIREVLREAKQKIDQIVMRDA